MNDRPLAVSVEKAAELISVSVPTLYRMRRDSQIEFRKVRGRTLVPMTEVERICNGEPKRDTVGEPVGEPQNRRVQKVKLVPQLT
jgi:excisionase family DNA binding protein